MNPRIVNGMHAVEITGWERGFNKVACTSTLCSVAGLGLIQAKGVTDAVLEGKLQRVELASRVEAERLVEFLRMHGALVRLAGPQAEPQG